MQTEPREDPSLFVQRKSARTSAEYWQSPTGAEDLCTHFEKVRCLESEKLLAYCPPS